MTVWTCSEAAWARASALTAPPLEPSTAAGPASRWASSRERSSARICGVQSCSGSSTGLRLIPRGSVVSTVWSAASRSASGVKDDASIGAPTNTTSGPAPRRGVVGVPAQVALSGRARASSASNPLTVTLRPAAEVVHPSRSGQPGATYTKPTGREGRGVLAVTLHRVFNHLSSGIAGLAVGAVLGLLLAVLFEDYLKELRSRFVGRIRRIRARGALPSTDKQFRIGDLHTSLIVLEGDGTQVIGEHAVRVIVEPENVSLPAELEGWRRELVEANRKAHDEGLHYFWNGLSYAVAGFSVSRSGIDETPHVALRLKGADYFTFLATQQLDRPFEDGWTPRSRFVDPFNPTEVPDFMCASFGAYIAVVTADNLSVFSKRSENVGAFRGRWDASVNEALSRSLDSRGRTPPNLYDLARRGLSEEMSLDPAEYRLEMLAFVTDRVTSQWGCLFVAFLHDLRGEELIARRSRGVPDRFEHEKHELVRFEVRPVIEYLLRSDRRDKWTPVAPALFYIALVRVYGRARVESETRKVIVTKSPRRWSRWWCAGRGRREGSGKASPRSAPRETQP